MYAVSCYIVLCYNSTSLYLDISKYSYQGLCQDTNFWGKIHIISVAVNYRYRRYKIDMKISIDNRYGFLVSNLTLAIMS